jgi:heme/copper-type cytochrome/quinol oxidase subunit 2
MLRYITTLAACVVVLGIAVSTFPQAPAAAGESHEIQMTAKRFEFNPNVITVNQGDHVKLIITALDRDHGFKLEAFGINQKLKKGDPATIEFTADKAGTFQFQCSDFCGIHHGRMKGKLIVK